MKKYSKPIIIIAAVIINVIVFAAARHWRLQKQQQYDEMVRHAERYQGATEDTITIFDNKTDRWIAEMKEEPIEVILQKGIVNVI